MSRVKPCAGCKKPSANTIPTNSGRLCPDCDKMTPFIPMKAGGVEASGGLVSDTGYRSGQSDRRGLNENRIQAAALPGSIGGPGFGNPFGNPFGSPFGNPFGSPFGRLGGLGGLPRVIVINNDDEPKEKKHVYVQKKDGELIEIDADDVKGSGIPVVCTKQNGVKKCIATEKAVQKAGYEIEDD